MAVLRILIGYVAAVVIAATFGSFVHTHMVVTGLVEAGSPVPAGQRLTMTLSDLAALFPQYGAVVAAALAVGFVVAAGLKRVLKPLAPVAYPLAGAAAIGLALVLMRMKFEGITPIAGARSTLGFALLCLGGAFGGVVFSAIAGRKRP